MPVNIDVFRLAAGLGGKRRIRPRWLVAQMKASGAHETVIYAEVFWRKSAAEKAQHDRNASVPVLGPVSIGTKRLAQLIRLPLG